MCKHQRGKKEDVSSKCETSPGSSSFEERKCRLETGEKKILDGTLRDKSPTVGKRTPYGPPKMHLILCMSARSSRTLRHKGAAVEATWGSLERVIPLLALPSFALHEAYKPFTPSRIFFLHFKAISSLSRDFALSDSVIAR